MKALLTAILLLVLTASAHATTRYVIPSAGATGCSNPDTDYNASTNTCGSGSSTVYTGSTWKTTGVAATAAGDILEFRAGTYTGDVDSSTSSFISGTALCAYGTATCATAPIFQCRSGETCTFSSFTEWTFRSTPHHVIFKRMTLSCSHNSEACVVFKSGSHHIRFEDMNVTNVNATAPVVVAPKFDSSDLEFIGGTYGPGYYCFYIAGDRVLLRRITCANTTNYGIHIHSSVGGGVPNDNIVEYSLIHTTATVNTAQAGVVLSTGSGNKVRYNVIRDGSGRGVNLAGNTANPSVYNNIIVQNAATCIFTNSGVTGGVYKNNLCLNTTSTEIVDGASGSTFSNNIGDNTGTGIASTSTLSALFTNEATNDFTLKAASPALAAGTASIRSGISLTCNGTCESGAYEGINSPAPQCRVDDGAANTVKVLFTANPNPPLQITNVTGTTVQVAGADRTESAPTVQGGGTEIWYTIDGAGVTNGQTVTWAAGSTNTITDSAKVGNSSSQGLHATGTITCNNLVGGGGGAYVFTITQTQFFEFFSPLNSLLGARGVENGDATIAQNGKTRLRYKIACTGAACPSSGALVRYSKNGGAYTALTASFADGIRMPGNIIHPDAPVCSSTTTEILTSGHATDQDGLYSCDPNAIPTVELVQNSEMENEVALEFDTTIVPTDQFCFKVTDHTGTELTNPDPPCLVVMNPGLLGRF